MRLGLGVRLGHIGPVRLYAGETLWRSSRRHPHRQPYYVHAGCSIHHARPDTAQRCHQGHGPVREIGG